MRHGKTGPGKLHYRVSGYNKIQMDSWYMLPKDRVCKKQSAKYKRLVSGSLCLEIFGKSALTLTSFFF